MATARRDRPNHPAHPMDTGRRADGATSCRAGLALTRPTHDVDMILHIQTGAVTFGNVRDDLEGLGYALLEPMGDGPVHRFARGRTSTEAIDVMVPDRLPEGKRPKALRRLVFAVPGGTSALMKTVICEVDAGVGVVTLSVPDVLGALVLKGAAYTADSRDRARHLDDAAVLACAVTDPVADRERRIGSDRKRLRALWNELQDVNHRSWIATGTAARRGRAALEVLAGD